MLYFDTSYVVRLYTNDPGWEKVRALAETDRIACCIHGRAETVAAFHRRFRESLVSQKEFAALNLEFERDCSLDAYRWFTLSPDVIARLASGYGTLPPTVVLRAADAIHLACAAQSGFRKIYSNDHRLLAAATYFGLSGENVI